MKKILISLMLLITVTSFTKPTEEKRIKICQTVGFCTACYATYTMQLPRGEAITVWEITTSCNGSTPVVLADGWYKEVE